MGFGDYPFGVDPFGLDPPPPDASTPPAVPPLAPFFDLATRTFPLTPDGLVKGTHPVDEKMVLALGLITGRLPCVPGEGIDLRPLDGIPDEKLQSAAEQIVRANTTIAKLIVNGDVEILAIRANRPTRGALYLEVDYVNNHTKQKVTARG